MAKRKRKRKTGAAKKMTAKRKTRKKGKRKGHVPLPILKRRLAKLSKIVASRS